MMNARIDRSHPSSPRLGFPSRRVAGVAGHRLPQRLIEGARLLEMDLKSSFGALRPSRFEAVAPERL